MNTALYCIGTKRPSARVPETALYCIGTKRPRAREPETRRTRAQFLTRWATRPATATRRAKGGACSEGCQLPGGGIRVCGPGAGGTLTERVGACAAT